MIWWHWRQRLIAGLVLAASAFLVADLVTLVMGASLEASMPPLRPAAPAATSLLEPAPDVDAILRGNLFHPEQRGGVAAWSTAEPPPAPIESTHRLVGTVSGSGSFGFAVLEEKSSRLQSLYRIDDLLPGGAQLVGIERYEIIIQVGPTTHRLAVEEDVPGATPVAAASAAGGARELAANHWLIERRKVEAALANLPQLLTQARLIPNFSGGKADGSRLVGIKPNSFFSDIGLQDGDILKRINGVEITDPLTLGKVFTQLQHEANINLDLQRSSQPLTLSYEIR